MSNITGEEKTMKEQQDFSLTCEKLKQQIINLLNDSSFPPVIKYYITKDVYAQVENSYINYINMQLKQEKEQKKEETGIE